MVIVVLAGNDGKGDTQCCVEATSGCFVFTVCSQIIALAYRVTIAKARHSSPVIMLLLLGSQSLVANLDRIILLYDNKEHARRIVLLLNIAIFCCVASG
jgi:hypothetical protein